jgi:hypothetical protein
LDTTQQYNRVFDGCRDIFLHKVRDYGCSWRVLRPTSLTDQLYIKAQRIRTLEQSRVRLVDEGIESEFQAIVNYAVIAGIQLQRGWSDERELDEAEALRLYDAERAGIQALMEAKNHDYGEAWRDMRVSSFTDMILVKLLRVKQIEANSGQTRISEGADSHYRDMANYALFALIRLGEQEEKSAKQNPYPSNPHPDHASD